MRCLFFLWVLCFILNPLQATEIVRVAHVVDGDTLVLEDGRRIRLIGIDTPEIHDENKLREESKVYHKDTHAVRAMGNASKAFVKKLVEGKRVQLETDIFNATNAHQDKYGRTLAYVKFDCKKPPQELLEYFKTRGLKIQWKKKNVFLNALILQCGYARMFKKFPFKYQDSFKEFEKKAKEDRMGIWRD
jgi:micrococcal nuclease